MNFSNSNRISLFFLNPHCNYVLKKNKTKNKMAAEWHFRNVLIGIVSYIRFSPGNCQWMNESVIVYFTARWRCGMCVCLCIQYVAKEIRQLVHQITQIRLLQSNISNINLVECFTVYIYSVFHPFKLIINVRFLWSMLCVIWSIQLRQGGGVEG